MVNSSSITFKINLIIIHRTISSKITLQLKVILLKNVKQQNHPLTQHKIIIIQSNRQLILELITIIFEYLSV